MIAAFLLSASLLGQAGEAALPTSLLDGDLDLDTRVNFSDIQHVLANWDEAGASSGVLFGVLEHWTPQPVPIAHWVTIPSNPGTVAQVAAAHVDGIDKVEFLHVNPDTGTQSFIAVHAPVRRYDVWVYEANFGPGVVQAFVHSNSGALTQLPFIDIGVARGPEVHVPGDFSTIYDAIVYLRNSHDSVGRVVLAAGNYTWPGGGGDVAAIQPGLGWLEIIGGQPNVQITQTNGKIKTRRVRFENITLDKRGIASSGIGGAERSIWFHDCSLYGSGPTHTLDFNGSLTMWEKKYYTRCGIFNVRRAPPDVDQFRECVFSNIGEDIFHTPRLVLSCNVYSLRKPGNTNYHSDLIQFRGTEKNVLIDNLYATDINAQCIFQRGSGIPGQRNVGVCIRNSSITADPQTPYLSQISLSTDHLILENLTLRNQPMWIRHDVLYPEQRDATILSHVSLDWSVFDDLWIQSGIIHPDSAVLDNVSR